MTDKARDAQGFITGDLLGRWWVTSLKLSLMVLLDMHVVCVEYDEQRLK